MAVNPLNYLVVPRLLAGVLMLPILTAIADFCGVIGGHLLGTRVLGINPGTYIGRTLDYVDVSDIFYGLTKALCFGLIISLIACFRGYYATGGAEGVGKAGTKAVVLASVLILISDYILTSLMF